MKKELRDLAAQAIEIAKGAGANACSVNISTARNVQLSYRDRKPETIKEASTRDLFLRIYVNGRYSTQNTSDLRLAPLKAFISNAVAMTKLLAEDPNRTLPDPKYYADRVEKDLGLNDPNHPKVTPAERHQQAKGIEEVCLTKGGAKVISVTTNVGDTFAEDLLINSNGFEGYSDSTSYYAYGQMTLQDEGDRRPMGFWGAATCNRKDLPTPEIIGTETVLSTQALLGSKKIKTETLPIIIENRNVARVLGNLMQAMFGRAIQQKQSFLADKKGKKIGSDLLTLIDDPFVLKGLGSRFYDGDGITAKRRTMIEAGMLKEFWVDWYYSRKLGWEPTTGNPSNLIIPPGTRSVKDIMKELGRGIYINGFIGGNANSTTGDSSVGISGHLFDKGELVQAVSEMNIAGNTLEFWSKLIEAANDPWIYGGQRLPSLVFKDVVVSGL